MKFYVWTLEIWKFLKKYDLFPFPASPLLANFRRRYHHTFTIYLLSLVCIFMLEMPSYVAPIIYVPDTVFKYHASLSWYWVQVWWKGADDVRVVVNNYGSRVVVFLINNLTKAQTSIIASANEEESVHHQVALLQNLLTFTP